MTTSIPFVASKSALRVFDACKAAGRPLPQFSKDEVLDYMVTEAIVAKAGERAKQEEKAREKEEWKKAAHQPGYQPQ